MRVGDRVHLGIDGFGRLPGTLYAKWPDRNGMNPNRYRTLLDCGGVVDTWHQPWPLRRREDPKRTGVTIMESWRRRWPEEFADVASAVSE